MRLQVQHYEFHLNDKYHPGQTIDASDALALNRTRADAIRNILSRRVESDIERRGLGIGEFLSIEDIGEIQSWLNATAEEFSFSFRSEPRPKIGTIDQEAREIAESQVISEELDGPQGAPIGRDRERRIRALMALPEIQAEARARLSAQAHIGQSSLEDLLR